jgi:hypothetical protein
MFPTGSHGYYEHADGSGRLTKSSVSIINRFTATYDDEHQPHPFSRGTRLCEVILLDFPDSKTLIVQESDLTVE